MVLGVKQEYNLIQRGLSHENVPTECGLTHVGLHPVIRIAQLPRWQLLSTSPVLSGIPLRIGFTRVVKTLKCNMSIAYRVKQCWCGWCSRLPQGTTLSHLCMQSINGFLNCFRTIYRHAVGAFIVINIREGGFVKSTDKLFGTPEIFMETSSLKLCFSRLQHC